ncbi:MAG: histidine kinase dimerization/phospho-acceptor domain-containing protein [Elusimicrobiota bacterium]
MKPRIILITSDKALAEGFSKTCEIRQSLLDAVSSVQDSRRLWQKEDTELAGVVADSQALREQEKRQLISLHLEPGAPKLILLEPQHAANPAASVEPVTRLRWPMDQAVLEGLRSLSGTPMVFLADQTLFLTGMLQARLQSIGQQAMLSESTVGISDLFKLQAKPLPQTEKPGKSGIFSRLIGKEEKGEVTPLPQQAGSTSVIVLWKGDAIDAENVEQRLRQEIRNVRVFAVSSIGSVHAVERAFRRAHPGFLPRPLFGQSADFLLGRQVTDPRDLGRVLYVDNFKPSLVQVTASLMSDGYDVSASMKGEEALEMAQNDRFHIAVMAAVAFGQHTGIELAQKMRELDPDLRIILMVERYPLEAALQGVSQVVEVGLDDCLLKPIEPSRLKFSISRALERRRLLLENARLLDELKESNQALEQLTGFQSKFFATVAHDVKNPLTAIRGYAELLSWKIKEADLLKCVTHIQSSSKALEGLVSDLVDFAAIESGKLRINMGEMDLAQVIGEVR